MIPETRRLITILAARPVQYGWREKAAALSNFVRGRLDFRMRYYVFSLADPKPFFTDMIGIIARLLRREK